jgi:hypothetical protein
MTTTAKPQDVKPESDDQYCKAEKLHKDLTQRIQTQQGTMIKVKPFEIEEKVYL